MRISFQKRNFPLSSASRTHDNSGGFVNGWIRLLRRRNSFYHLPRKRTPFVNTLWRLPMSQILFWRQSHEMICSVIQCGSDSGRLLSGLQTNRRRSSHRNTAIDGSLQRPMRSSVTNRRMDEMLSSNSSLILICRCIFALRLKWCTHVWCSPQKLSILVFCNVSTESTDDISLSTRRDFSPCKPTSTSTMIFLHSCHPTEKTLISFVSFLIKFHAQRRYIAERNEHNTYTYIYIYLQVNVRLKSISQKTKLQVNTPVQFHSIMQHSSINKCYSICDNAQPWDAYVTGDKRFFRSRKQW